MSIGPTPKEDDAFIQTPTQKAVNATKKVAEAFFFDPVHYLFYGSLTGIIIGLFFHITFSWELYAITLVLGAIELFRHLNPERTGVPLE